MKVSWVTRQLSRAGFTLVEAPVPLWWWRPLPLKRGSEGFTPGKFFKIDIQSNAFWCIFAHFWLSWLTSFCNSIFQFRTVLQLKSVKADNVKCCACYMWTLFCLWPVFSLVYYYKKCRQPHGWNDTKYITKHMQANHITDKILTQIIKNHKCCIESMTPCSVCSAVAVDNLVPPRHFFI